MGTENWCTAFLWIGALKCELNNKSWGWCYQSIENKTVLIAECEKGHKHAVRKLIKYDADVIYKWLMNNINTSYIWFRVFRWAYRLGRYNSWRWFKHTNSSSDENNYVGVNQLITAGVFSNQAVSNTNEWEKEKCSLDKELIRNTCMQWIHCDQDFFYPHFH